jgi:uncharacterized protein (TIGR02246 family)
MANQRFLFTKEPDLDSSPNLDVSSDVSKIAAVWEAWNAALKANDADRLAAFVTDDIVFVHGDGRCVIGKEDLKADFLTSFERFDFDRRFSPPEIIVRDKWAFEISEVESTMTSVRGGIQVHAHSRTVFTFARQPDTTWKVARVLELLD